MYIFIYIYINIYTGKYSSTMELLLSYGHCQITAVQAVQCEGITGLFLLVLIHGDFEI